MAWYGMAWYGMRRGPRDPLGPRVPAPRAIPCHTIPCHAIPYQYYHILILLHKHLNIYIIILLYYSTIRLCLKGFLLLLCKRIGGLVPEVPENPGSLGTSSRSLFKLSIGILGTPRFLGDILGSTRVLED